MSQEHEMYSVGNIVNSQLISLYGDISELDLYGDHFEMHRNTEALCCIKGTNFCCRSDALKRNKHKKGNEICRYERWGEGKLDKGSQKV